MIRTGEKYAYAAFLCGKKFYRAGVKFIYQDIGCKHSTWLPNAASKVASCTAEHPGAGLAKEVFGQPCTAQHVLAEVHGRGHSLWCQVIAAA